MKELLKKKRIILIVDFVIIILCIAADRFLKYYALNTLKERPDKAIIKGILEFRYLENSGAAFGVLKGEKSFFILVTSIMLFAIFYAIFKMPAKERFYPIQIFMSFFIGGSIGNLIDRIMYNYVIDYIYFSAFKFPIFNLADCFITIATILIIIFILFYYKENDMNFLKVKENKFREMD